MRKAEQNLLERTEMRMLSLMMGIKRIEKIENEDICAREGVTNISENRREALLGVVERNTEEDVGPIVMRTWNMEVGGHPRNREKI